MNPVQARVVQLFRATLADDRKLAAQSDADLARMLFVNFRTETRSRGLRLTNFGLQIMLGMFQAFDIVRPEGQVLQSRELLYLDNRATLPYYLTDRRLVVFETELGVLLRLAGGDIGGLIDIESGVGMLNSPL